MASSAERQDAASTSTKTVSGSAYILLTAFSSPTHAEPRYWMGADADARSLSVHVCPRHSAGCCARERRALAPGRRAHERHALRPAREGLRDAGHARLDSRPARE